MKIIYVLDAIAQAQNGITTRIVSTIQYLREWGHEVHIFTGKKPFKEYFPNSIVHSFSSLPYPSYPAFQVVIPGKHIRTALKKIQPDLVHIVNPFWYGFRVSSYAKELGFISVTSIHADINGYCQAYHLGFAQKFIWKNFKNCCDRAALCLCASSVTMDQVRQHGISNVELWQPAVDTERFNPKKNSLKMRAHLSQGNPDAPLFIYVGRLSIEKNIPFLRNLFDAIPSAHLAIIGDGPMLSTLKKYFKGTACHFTGVLEGEELSAAYASADVFLFASKTDALGFVLLEAMASNILVITARAGGCTDIVKDDFNGLLFEPDDVADMHAKLKQFVSNPELMNRLKRNGLNMVQKMSWRDSTLRLMDQYNKSISATEKHHL